MEYTPGLLRIICIDAHIAGKRMEVKLPHHANISGSNGSGKTTLLKLVPFFYGAAPSDLVERVGKKSSFTDFYLGRPTSLIVFEYMTPRGPKCAVVYRHTTGMKPAYRFLDEPFEVDYFSELRGDEPVFLEGRSLGRHWTTLGLVHSNQLESVTDYRAVIQGDRSLIHRSAQSRELLSLVALYALGGRVGAMGHINKMTSVILSRRSSMEGIKQMISEIMREEQIELPPLKLHKNVRDIVAELSVLRHLDKNEALFREVVSQGLGYLDNAQSLQNVGAELHTHLVRLNERLGTLKQQCDQNREDLKVRMARWETDGDDLQKQLHAARAVLDTADKQLTRLDAEYDAWAEQDMLRKKADFSNLGDFVEQMDDARRQLRVLEEGISDLTQHYNELKNREGQRHHQNVARLTDRQVQNMQAKNDAEKQWQERARVIDADKFQAQKTYQEKRSDNLNQLREQIAQTRFAAGNTVPTEEETLALSAAESDRERLEEQLSQVNAKVTEAERLVEQRRSESAEADKAVSQARQRLAQEEATHERLRELCNPVSGSLLSELRDKDPAWHGTLGKVIREELLGRKDLSPVYTEMDHNESGQRGLLGWSLNLDKLDKPEWACSLEEQEARLEAQGARLDLAGQQYQIKQEVCDKALKSLKSMQDERDDVVRAKHQATRRYEAAKDAVRTVKANNHNSASERRQRAREQLAEQEKELEQLNAQIVAELDAIEARYATAYREAQGQHASNLSLLDEELDMIVSDLAAEKTGFADTLAQLEQDFKAQCAAAGMDEQVLEKAMRRVKQARDDHDRVSGYRDLVLRYDTWLVHEWPRRSEFEQQRASGEADVSRFDMEYRDAEREFKRERDQLNERFNQWRGEISSGTDQREASSAMLKRAELSSAMKTIDNPRPLDAVLADADSLLTEQQRIIKQVRNGVGKVESVIAGQGERNQIAEAWLQLKRQAEAKLTDPNDVDLLSINLTHSLDELMRVHLPQKKETIESFVRTISDQLSAFYIGLNKVSQLIKRQSRDISASISAKQYFAAIGNIGVSLNSRIDSQDYWPYLEKFERSYQAWKLSGDPGLPPQELDEQLIAVTDILHRSHIAKGIESVFDLEISLEENARVVTVNNSRDLENASSNGLSYLILCSIFAGITRMLCRDREIRIHWPVDELGVIDSINVASLFSMLNDHNIVMVGGFPTTDPLLLQHFTDRHEMRKGEGLVDIQLPEDKLTALIAARRKQAQATETGGEAKS